MGDTVIQGVEKVYLGFVGATTERLAAIKVKVWIEVARGRTQIEMLVSDFCII